MAKLCSWSFDCRLLFCAAGDGEVGVGEARGGGGSEPSEDGTSESWGRGRT